MSVGAISQNFKAQLLDLPNKRSSHTQPIPRGGGLGFIIAFFLMIPVNQSIGETFATASLWVWLSLLPLIVIGFIDDWKTLPAGIRYIGQISVGALIVIQCGPFLQPWLNQLGALGWWIEIATTIIGLTALINFYNFMDGMDGLVAGVSAIQLGFMAVWSQEPVLWLLVSALVGFLYWNWSPAKIFMGDVGSTFLGAVMAIALLNQTGSVEQSWAALAITLPITGDAIYTLFCRAIRGENIFKAHRSHIYQRLHQAGWSHGRVAAVYVGATVGLALLIYGYGGWGAWSSLIGVAIAILVAERYLSTRQQPLSHSND
ncbi:glycosyltransferase family 4 protein [Acaryochloris sp. IP29b_bin.137]|uniref:MraY family glycosyltransferase n=1 Tax=Acaryochloris sp. IP29b_bin.137 TaxID=2969217 RepID=UPI00263361B0|nr:glycosyltransferase family 4 protein [Acaryochloris sp. IP29b_bin.137]